MKKVMVGTAEVRGEKEIEGKMVVVPGSRMQKIEERTVVKVMEGSSGRGHCCELGGEKVPAVSWKRKAITASSSGLSEIRDVC